MFNNMKNGFARKGFTIIELIISIFVLSVAVVGIFSAFSIVMILTSDSSDRLTATYLTQEGMEIVRNIRDQNWLNMDNCYAGTLGAVCSPWPTWLDGLTSSGSCSPSSTGCAADYTSTNMLAYNSNDFLCINGAGFYYQSIRDCGSSKTKFKRKILINTLTPYAINVTVQVSWDKKATLLNATGSQAGNCGADNCISAEETLYNWYNTPSSEKIISTFNFINIDGNGTNIIGSIVQNTHEITLEVPSGTYLTLAPTIEVSPGASVNPASGSEQSFTDGVSFTYTVTAADGSTQPYYVTVNVAH